MPPRDRDINVVRIVQGVKGTVRMWMEMTIRFDYGSIVPWVSHERRLLKAVAGPDDLYLRTEVELRGKGFRRWLISRSRRTGHPLCPDLACFLQRPSAPHDPRTGALRTVQWWKKWSSGCTHQGPLAGCRHPFTDYIEGSDYAPTGGIVAPPTMMGTNSNRGTFVQYYGSSALDGSLLMIPLVGFLPPSDPRVRGTLRAIEQDLQVEGLVMRYRPAGELDGLPDGEGVFLPCSFWLVDNLVLAGRREEARELYSRLVGLSNDVGLLSEEYDLKHKRLVGNFPQAFSHVSLINSAYGFSRLESPSEHRQRS